jgi:membrane-bound lytic murein transglycosylase D
MTRKLFAFSAITAAFLSVLLFASFAEALFDNSDKANPETEETTPVTTTKPDTKLALLPQVIHSIPMREEYSFAGEPLPMDNFDVVERLDRELSVNAYWHSNALLVIKGAYRYFPVIEKILAKHGVPDDFKYLAVAESALRHDVSPAGASSFWQFRKGAASDMKLTVNGEVDERYDIEKSTEAACKYLLKRYERFGSWTLAAAAYNMGPTALVRAMESQATENYYDLNLSDETMRYVFRIVAIKELIANHRHYGFFLDAEEKYTPLNDYRTVMVDTTISSLGEFAQHHGTTYRMLKIYNPWLRSHSLTNSKGVMYEIRLPL